ncbi:sensor histidine kinase [Streptomyces prunicolor]|uniref:sensor histidine kinase n=1 Tax=Streptomyces prunicolor TaxID=67348 RepID=UPI00372469FB
MSGVIRPWLPAVAVLSVGGAASAVAALVLGEVMVSVRFAPALGVAVLAAGVAMVLVAVVLVRRRTERLRAQLLDTAAKEAREEHRRFLRRLDHELKNPLTAIRIGVANLSAADLDEAARGTAARVDDQVLRLVRITRDLRKLAAIEDQAMERFPVPLAALLETVGEAAGELPDGDERKITVTVPDVPWPLSQPPGDADLLELALHNLVANAVKYSGPGCSVALRAFEESAHVVVEVADTGQGIPADELPYVWDELVRGSEVRDIPGSGVGLALVQAVVSRHGGECEIRSRPGSGTVVRIRLPLV